MPSYYCPDLDQNSQILELAQDEFHHLCRVKRKQIGAILLLNSGSGFLAEARIKELYKDRTVLDVLDIKTASSVTPDFAIAFALLKNHHDELAIEKCTELGAREFFPLTTQNSVRGVGKNTVARFRKVALSAIKQCDNPFLPMVHEPLDLKEAISLIASRGYTPLLCSEKEKGTMLKDLDSRDKLCFIVGPEGGFTAEEFELMIGLKSIMLSSLILRAETAAIAASAQFAGFRYNNR
jgi:16S rRNA (uracil1498-N3)-methyltransferase